MCMTVRNFLQEKEVKPQSKRKKEEKAPQV
jgi:hypothetical protein